MDELVFIKIGPILYSNFAMRFPIRIRRCATPFLAILEVVMTPIPTELREMMEVRL